AVGPFEPRVGVGKHIFVDALERRPDRVVLVLGPVLRENVIGPLAQQQVVIGADDLAERRFERLIPEVERPAPEGKVAGLILLRAARVLHLAVERLEHRAGELTHRRSPRAPPPRSSRCRSCASSSSPRRLASPPLCRWCVWP